MGESGLFVRLSWEEWLLYCMQRMQAAWRGILVCLCASWGQPTKRYLGRCIGLTLPRFEQAAQELWHDTPDISHPKERTAASQLYPSPTLTHVEQTFLP